MDTLEEVCRMYLIEVDSTKGFGAELRKTSGGPTFNLAADGGKIGGCK